MSKCHFVPLLSAVLKAFSGLEQIFYLFLFHKSVYLNHQKAHTLLCISQKTPKNPQKYKVNISSLSKLHNSSK